MEEYKLWYFSELTERMERRIGISKAKQLNNCLTALEELESEAKAYYAETITLHSSDFLEMMLLDGCFIIELFYRSVSSDYQDAKKIDPLFKASWIRYTLSKDLIHIENQLPFFVLKKLWGMIGFVPDSLLLIHVAWQFIPIYSHFPPAQQFDECQITSQSIYKLFANLTNLTNLTSPSYPKFKVLDVEKVGDIKHLLDLVYKFMLIEETLEVKQEINHAAKLEDTAGIVKCLLDLVCKFMLNGKTSKQGTNHGAKKDDAYGIGPSTAANKPRKSTYSATKLSDFGVRFEATKMGKFYDIKFEDGVLKIPIIQIQHKRYISKFSCI